MPITFHNMPLKYMKGIFESLKLNRSYDGEFSSWQQKLEYNENLEVTGVIVKEIGCVLYINNVKTGTTELGVYVYPNKRGRAHSKRLFKTMKEYGYTYDNLLNSKDTLMQAPTNKLARFYLNFRDIIVL